MINISLRCKDNEIQTTRCEVISAVDLPHDEFESFRTNLLHEYPFIADHADEMSADSSGVHRCILVLDSGNDDGILVHSSGANYARYAAFVPGARIMSALESHPTLDTYVRRMSEYVDRFARYAVDCQHNGRYICDCHDLMKTVDFECFSEDLFAEMITECPEFKNVEYDNGSYVCYIADEYLSVIDESEYRTLSHQEIEVMCAKHVLWLNDEGGEQADFSGCLIRNVDLSRMKLRSAKFDGAWLENVGLRDAELCFASMNGISLYKCDLSSLTADECSMKNAKAVSCQLDYSIFTHSNLAGAMFRECSLANTHLMNCCIDGTDFGDASLSSVDLHGVSSNETEWASEPDISM